MSGKLTLDRDGSESCGGQVDAHPDRVTPGQSKTTLGGKHPPSPSMRSAHKGGGFVTPLPLGSPLVHPCQVHSREMQKWRLLHSTPAGATGQGTEKRSTLGVTTPTKEGTAFACPPDHELVERVKAAVAAASTQ